MDAFKSLLPSILQVSDRIERSAVIGELSESLRLDREIVAREMRSDTRIPRPRKESSVSLPPNELFIAFPVS